MYVIRGRICVAVLADAEHVFGTEHILYQSRDLEEGEPQHLKLLPSAQHWEIGSKVPAGGRLHPPPQLEPLKLTPLGFRCLFCSFMFRILRPCHDPRNIVSTTGISNIVSGEHFSC